MSSYSDIRLLGLNCRQWRNSSDAQKGALVATRLLRIGGAWQLSPKASRVRGIVQKLDEYCALVAPTNATGFDGMTLPAGQLMGPRILRYVYDPINVVLPQETRSRVTDWLSTQAYGYTCDAWQLLSREKRLYEIMQNHPAAPTYGASLFEGEAQLARVNSGCRSNAVDQMLRPMPVYEVTTQRVMYPVVAAGDAAPATDTSVVATSAVPVVTPPTAAQQVAAAVAPHVAQEAALTSRRTTWQFIAVATAVAVTLAILVK